MSKIEEVINGFSNLAKSELGMLPEEKIKLFNDRMSICNSCEFKTALGRCGKCGCVLAAKTKCEECTCPIDKW